jgi:transposase
MGEAVQLEHERVDDLPLLFGLMQQLELAALLDEQLGHHGLHQGLSNGWLACVWLVYILSEGDHRKAAVADWAARHRQTLERLLGQPLRESEFTDDRLAILLHRLSEVSVWHAIEAALWQKTLCIYELPLSGVRLDGTTTYGFHAPTPDSLMQVGHSKDHRPDLAQVRLMAACAQPSGQLIATDVHAGNRVDDPCYLPLIQRVRQILGRSGLLYAGDCKMGALAVRAHLAKSGDYYLMPLSRSGEAHHLLDGWLAAFLQREVAWELAWQGTRILGAGGTLTRELHWPKTSPASAAACFTWQERVLLVCSPARFRQESQELDDRLEKATAALLALTPPKGPGKRCFRQPTALRAAIRRVEERYEVGGLLQVRWQRQQTRTFRQIGPGRPSPKRAVRSVFEVRYMVVAVEPREAAIAAAKERLGWRLYATNAPATPVSFSGAVGYYHGGWCLERDFHLLKDHPLGIRPLYVRRNDQLQGLTHLLTLGVRLLTLLEGQVRQSLASAGEGWAGLYEGQPQRRTTSPSAPLLLKAVARTEITLTRIRIGNQAAWHLTPLSPVLHRLLACLGLSTWLYEQLTHNPP